MSERTPSVHVVGAPGKASPRLGSGGSGRALGAGSGVRRRGDLVGVPEVPSSSRPFPSRVSGYPSCVTGVLPDPFSTCPSPTPVRHTGSRTQASESRRARPVVTPAERASRGRRERTSGRRRERTPCGPRPGSHPRPGAHRGGTKHSQVPTAGTGVTRGDPRFRRIPVPHILLPPRVPPLRSGPDGPRGLIPVP